MAALSFTSCQKEESYIANQKFIASFEQAGNDKVTSNSDLEMYWESSGSYSDIGVYAPGFVNSDGQSQVKTYRPSTISTDLKTAVLESTDPFPANQQGPFYAISRIINNASSYINEDGSFHAGKCRPQPSLFFPSAENVMPMIARADNYGELKFKHLFGILKIFLNLPEGFVVNQIFVAAAEGSLLPTCIDGCDVYWDDNDNISLANISLTTNWSTPSAYRGRDFYYVPVCPGDWSNLRFRVIGWDSVTNHYNVVLEKTMAEGATIHIERAGITTLTLNYTENDR